MKSSKQPKDIFLDYLFLYIAFFIFSCSSIFNKIASRYPLLSIRFLMFYALGLGVMVVYAFLWQKVLKRFELSVAYANRPVVTLFGMLWGVLLFHETITWNMVLGAIVIVFGIWLVITGNE